MCLLSMNVLVQDLLMLLHILNVDSDSIAIKLLNLSPQIYDMLKDST